MPAALHTISSCCGLTIGEATATPIVSANHSNASLAIQGEVRRVWRTDMGRDYGIDKTQAKRPRPSSCRRARVVQISGFFLQIGVRVRVTQRNRLKLTLNLQEGVDHVGVEMRAPALRDDVYRFLV